MESEAVCAGERLQLLAHFFVAEDQPGPARSGHHEVLDRLGLLVGAAFVQLRWDL